MFHLKILCYFLFYVYSFIYFLFWTGRFSGEIVFLTAQHRISFTGPLNNVSWRLLSGLKATS